MQMQTLGFRVISFMAGVALLAFSGGASADPPSRIARLGYMSGAVSFSPAGENDWDQARINRPLTTGDRLWADARGRAEIQLGGALVRLNAGTGLSILNLDDRIAQLQLTQGTLNVRVRRLEPGQVFEVDTPNLAFTLRKPGAYRIEVDPDGNATAIIVRKGQGEVYGEGAAYVIDARQAYRFTGTGLREYQYVDAPRPDEFDRWAADRDRRYDNSSAARYVSQDVVGYQDLDANGTWRRDQTYGNVWIPSRVAAGWAPYRDGHWAWIDPWGWTWVDDAPWGFAVSHYGRWANLRGTWGWVPGPVRSRAYYAPALVVFVGGHNFQLAISSGNVGGVAWFPLAPREVYRPAYPVSRGYFENINRSNTVVSNTVIDNSFHNSTVNNVVYVNRQVPGAIVAVPTTAFVQSQPVSRTAQRVSREVLVSAPLAVVAPVAPIAKSVRGAAPQAEQPPSRVFARPVVARATPPTAHAGFEAQRQQLSAQPGKPLDDAARKELKPAASVPAPVVKVVAPTPEAPQAMRAPPAPARSGDRRGSSEQRDAGATPAISGAAPPVLAPSPAARAAPPTQAPEPRGRRDERGQSTAPAQAIPPPPITRSPETRGKAESRGNGEQRREPFTSPPPPAQRSAEPQIDRRPTTPSTPAAQAPEPRGRRDERGQTTAPVEATPPPPITRSPETRGNSESRGNAEQRREPVASPPPPAQRAAEPQIAPRQATPPAPPAQAPEPRGRREERAPPLAAPQPAPPAPTARSPEARGQPEARENGERRGQSVVAPPPPAPPPRAAEPKAMPPQAAPPVPQPAAPPKPAAQQPAPEAASRGQGAKPEAGKPNEKKKDGGEQKHDEENRKQER